MINYLLISAILTTNINGLYGINCPKQINTYISINNIKDINNEPCFYSNFHGTELGELYTFNNICDSDCYINNFTIYPKCHQTEPICIPHDGYPILLPSWKNIYKKYNGTIDACWPICTTLEININKFLLKGDIDCTINQDILLQHCNKLPPSGNMLDWKIIEPQCNRYPYININKYSIFNNNISHYIEIPHICTLDDFKIFPNCNQFDLLCSPPLYPLYTWKNITCWPHCTIDNIHISIISKHNISYVPYITNNSESSNSKNYYYLFLLLLCPICCINIFIILCIILIKSISWIIDYIIDFPRKKDLELLSVFSRPIEKFKESSTNHSINVILN